MMTTKMPSIPFPMIPKEIKKFSIFMIQSSLQTYNICVSRLNIIPPATTEPICPDTLAPTACIKR